MKDKEREKARAIADEVRQMTVEEAANLPNLMGRIISTRLKSSGWYCYRDVSNNNKKIFVEGAI